MTNPTSNYSWVLPNSADLVTDLPADFDVALQGVDTRLKALQPGTTLGDLAYSSATANTNTRLGVGTNGQVLAVVAGVPAWQNGTTGDIEGVTAGVGISGGGTSGTVTVTNSMATAITTNGDLIYGTGSGTFTRRGIGSTGDLLSVVGGVPTWSAPVSSSPASATAYVATTEATTSLTFTGLSTASSVTVTTGTKALVSISANFQNVASGNVQGYMGFAVSGASTIAASDQFATGYSFLQDSQRSSLKYGATFLITGLTAGSNTFTTQFKRMDIFGGGGTPYFGERSIVVMNMGS